MGLFAELFASVSRIARRSVPLEFDWIVTVGDVDVVRISDPVQHAYGTTRVRAEPLSADHDVHDPELWELSYGIRHARYSGLVVDARVWSTRGELFVSRLPSFLSRKQVREFSRPQTF